MIKNVCRVHLSLSNMPNEFLIILKNMWMLIEAWENASMFDESENL